LFSAQQLLFCVWNDMDFEFEPTGVNDTCLQLSRNGASCIMTFGSTWNRLIRVDYSATGFMAGFNPHIIFLADQVGWDGDRFRHRGQAEALTVSADMADILVRRGLATTDEARLWQKGPAGRSALSETDDTLLVRSMLGGATLSPVYDDSPLRRVFGETPRVTGYVLRTPADASPFLLSVLAGRPALDESARAALRRQFPRPA
jgi:hypothetical protein